MILDTLKVKDGTESHGTHCAYIAAGTPVEGVNGLTGNTLGGMAPDAELILCTDQPDKDSDGEAIVDVSNSTSDFLDYMKHYAEKNNKELVVSYSMNEHNGWHNGTSPTSQLLGEFAKNNVLMLCASNEGDDSIYIHRTVNVGGFDQRGSVGRAIPLTILSNIRLSPSRLPLPSSSLFLACRRMAGRCTSNRSRSLLRCLPGPIIMRR